MSLITIEDETIECKFAIPGLAFEANVHFPARSPLEMSKLASSPGPLISDYVTHERGFAYGTYGIHVGQEDRLTFFGDVEGKITGYFVDCRADSPARRTKVLIEFSPSLARRLIVPQGVAHTFDGLEFVVTRDEPIWYMDEGNPDYNIDNDLVSVPREAPLEDFPLVRVNQRRLSDEGHRLFSRFQQRVLNSPVGYSQREKVTVAGESRYILLSHKTWTDRFEAEFADLLADSSPIQGVEVRKNAFALTGPNSYTVVPSYSHCISDVLSFVPNLHFRGQFKVHSRGEVSLCALNPVHEDVVFDLLDLREASPTRGARHRLSLRLDPRHSIRIPAGVAHCMDGRERLFVRCEQRFFVGDHEPRLDLPKIGSDVRWLSAPNLDCASEAIDVPELELPDSAMALLARLEIENFSKTQNQPGGGNPAQWRSL